MPIWLDVNPRSGVPIYLQIVDGVRRALEVGSLRPGDPLPTVRQLSGELSIAPNTIVKAYAELQRNGLIESRAGVGTVVTAGLEPTLRRGQVEALFERVRVLVRDAAALGLELDELEDRFRAEVALQRAASGNEQDRPRDDNRGDDNPGDESPRDESPRDKEKS